MFLKSCFYGGNIYSLHLDNCSLDNSSFLLIIQNLVSPERNGLSLSSKSTQPQILRLFVGLLSPQRRGRTKQDGPSTILSRLPRISGSGAWRTSTMRRLARTTRPPSPLNRRLGSNLSTAAATGCRRPPPPPKSAARRPTTTSPPQRSPRRPSIQRWENVPLYYRAWH